MTQYARPSADESTPWTGWTGSYTAIDEVSANDSDYLTGAGETNGTAYVSLGSVTDPESSSEHILRYRVWQQDKSFDRTCTVSLKQGASTITSDVIDLSTFKGTPTQFNQTLSSGEADTISDYSDLHLELLAGGSIGAPAKNQASIYFSWAVLEVPDASGNVTVAPAAVNVVSDRNNPVTVLGSIGVAPTAGSGVAAKNEPGVVLGSITLEPTAVSGVAGKAEPTTIQGSITLEPAYAKSIANRSQGIVIHGSILITPDALVAVMSGADPSVDITSNTITPTPISAIGSSANPVVVLGSVSVSPDAGTLVTSRNNPGVILGSIVVAPDAISTVTGIGSVGVVQGSIQLDLGSVNAVSKSSGPSIYVDGGEGITPNSADAEISTAGPLVRIFVLNPKKNRVFKKFITPVM